MRKCARAGVTHTLGKKILTCLPLAVIFFPVLCNLRYHFRFTFYLLLALGKRCLSYELGMRAGTQHLQRGDAFAEKGMRTVELVCRQCAVSQREGRTQAAPRRSQNFVTVDRFLIF